jgi:hypothetical protein
VKQHEWPSAERRRSFLHCTSGLAVQETRACSLLAAAIQRNYGRRRPSLAFLPMVVAIEERCCLDTIGMPGIVAGSRGVVSLGKLLRVMALRAGFQTEVRDSTMDCDLRMVKMMVCTVLVTVGGARSDRKHCRFRSHAPESANGEFRS